MFHNAIISGSQNIVIGNPTCFNNNIEIGPFEIVGNTNTEMERKEVPKKEKRGPMDETPRISFQNEDRHCDLVNGQNLNSDTSLHFAVHQPVFSVDQCRLCVEIFGFSSHLFPDEKYGCCVKDCSFVNICEDHALGKFAYVPPQAVYRYGMGACIRDPNGPQLVFLSGFGDFSLWLCHLHAYRFFSIRQYNKEEEPCLVFKNENGFIQSEWLDNKKPCLSLDDLFDMQKQDNIVLWNRFVFDPSFLEFEEEQKKEIEQGFTKLVKAKRESKIKEQRQEKVTGTGGGSLYGGNVTIGNVSIGGLDADHYGDNFSVYRPRPVLKSELTKTEDAKQTKKQIKQFIDTLTKQILLTLSQEIQDPVFHVPELVSLLNEYLELKDDDQIKVS